MPKDYIKPSGILEGGLLTKLSANGPKNDWIVYSDRADNPTYQSPGGAATGKKLQFMESFYVIGEKKGYVHLIKYNPTMVSGNARKVNKNAEDYGWVEKNKLLLWRNSIINQQTDFAVKALTVHDISILDSKVTGKKLRFYNSPTLNPTLENENDVPLLEFLFVYKKEGDNYLVGVSQSLPQSKVGAQNILKGWLSESFIEIWAQRLCIEPNYNKDAANERKGKGIKASLLSSDEAASSFRTNGNAPVNTILWDNDQYENKFPPNWKRLPILSRLDKTLYKTGVITDILDKNNDIALTIRERTEIEKAYSVIRDKRENINIMFVIDGTQSSHPFFTPITNGIEKSINIFKNEKKKYKIGAVIYGNSGQGVLEKYSLTTNHESIIRKLGDYRDKTDLTEDNDDPSDMYAGVLEALRKFEESNQTNIIVLIGDAGNALNAFNANKSELIRKMKDRECGLISFQTRNISHRISDVFINQTKELIVGTSSRPTFEEPILYHIEENNTFRVKYPEESLVPGSLTHADRKGAMSQAELEKEISSMLSSFEEQHERLKKELDCKIYIDCKITINEAVLDYILSKLPGVDYDEDLKDRLRTMDHQFFIESYAAMETEELDQPLFTHVLFLTDRELYALEDNLEKLVGASNDATELREQIVDSYKEILEKHYGSGGNKRELARKTAAEILELVTGLPSSSELLGKYTIADLEDRRKVSDNKIQEIFIYMEDKLRDMKKVVGNTDYSFRSRDETYYWVPQDVLP